MLCDRGNQESAILWTFSEHLVVRDDLVLGFLHLDHVPELVWLAGLPLANDFRVRLVPRQLAILCQRRHCWLRALLILKRTLAGQNGVGEYPVGGY
jgi:hypothetical protein